MAFISYTEFRSFSVYFWWKLIETKSELVSVNEWLNKKEVLKHCVIIIITLMYVLYCIEQNNHFYESFILFIN